ncbi:MAG TPA: DUF924 family protein [Gammaproteobacteria bacterium]
MDERIEQLRSFWFEPAPRTKDDLERRFDRWFNADDETDAVIAERFGDLAERAARGELDHWRDDPRGRLALILLFDQVPRNLHRGTADAFAQDAKALALTIDGIESGMDQALPVLERAFFYMPLQHAEERDAQELSVRMFRALRDDPDVPEAYAAALDDMLHYAELHRDIVERFGRFPHRNRALGRPDTDAEREYLQNGGPRFGQ